MLHMLLLCYTCYVIEPLDQANRFNEFFASVFTVDNDMLYRMLNLARLKMCH